MTAGPGLRRSIATVSVSGTLEEKLHAISLAGFDGIELFEADLVGCPWPPSEVRRRCADLGLRIELYQPLRDLEAVPRERHAACLFRAREKLLLAAELGAPAVLACSNVSTEALDDDDLAAQDLHGIGQLAADLGLRVAYEALSWGRWVNTYAHAHKIVEMADHPSVGICIDSFHVLSVGDSIEGLDVDPDRLVFLQLADAPYIRMDLLQWSRHHRCFPGQGGFDLVGFTACVLAAGYRGPLSLEIFNDVIRRTDALATAIDAMRSLLALEDGLARSARLPDPDDGPLRLRALPQGSQPERTMGVALRGDAAVAVGVEQILSRMGFEDRTVEGDWRERRWRSGDVEISVRREPRALAASEPVIGELTLACADPAALAARARSLLAPTRELVPPPSCEVAAPDRRVIRAVPSTGVDGPPSSSPIQGIDHVVVTVTDDDFDEAMLFYRSVLLLEAQPGEELASPDGLVRSRALSGRRDAPMGCVRIALNAPLLQGIPAQLHEREHVAFSCADLVSVARAWRRLGVPLLNIPENYYDDLRARLGVEGNLLETLRELGILYDVDAAGHELLHCYTEAVGSRLFFELVQRADGYEGYGAGNATVRMAAQRWRERAAAAS